MTIINLHKRNINIPSKKLTRIDALIKDSKAYYLTDDQYNILRHMRYILVEKKYINDEIVKTVNPIQILLGICGDDDRYMC
jgi:hypothetical protein